ncbi:HAD-IIA family hydrolase [uncultured Anaeromusa sp.]|uniref:HAD-IIA family hydrolase n=2 Tax=Anaeromusa TaxID=81463 RepID=UPI0029C80A6F|nr:HAD-IIA family hydrolase [uncultured Anaeromusa sp.]
MMNDMERLHNLKYFALDMDGTIYLGQKLLPGALDFLQYLKDSGRKHLFLTNNSSKHKHSYVEKLQKLGINATDKEVMTSGEATALYLQAHNMKQVYLLGTPDLEDEFRQHGLTLTCDKPACVVLGFDQTLTYAKLTEACHLLREGVPFIATHPDINCPTNERSGYLPDTGAMLKLIEASTGVTPQLIIGKPHQEIINVLMSTLHCTKEETAMVGDRLYTDIQLAANSGVCGVLVLSGESTRSDVATSSAKPTFIFENVGELANALRTADAALGRTPVLA